MGIKIDRFIPLIYSPSFPGVSSASADAPTIEMLNNKN